ncbi:hypothetical protein ACFOD4_04715 [Pseudoroseomonas globiformis]|uniref:Uncharacterized protein n=1 Tax=Teichococcus globiformis TaxID=2307229 RepID=A0ABV7FYT9_9PROT
MQSFTQGQSFTELPGGRYDVSTNARQTKLAKLLAVFVVDTDDTERTTRIVEEQ